MAATYNKSFVRAFDIAHGAATIDRSIIPPLFTHTSTLREQVADLFPSVYLRKKHLVQWQPHNTVFAIWSGIVDIALSVREKNSTELVPRFLHSYGLAIDQVSRNPHAKSIQLIIRTSSTNLAPATSCSSMFPPCIALLATRTHL